MRKVDLPAFVRDVAGRKTALGITDDTIIRARNSGARRTPEKCEMLARMRQRAEAAGLEPLPANFKS